MIFRITLILLMLAGYVNAQVKQKGIDWASFMKRQVLVWDSISTDYYTGIILGNGQLGTNIYKESANALRFDIGRTDVIDQRTQLLPEAGTLYTQARLPIGHFSLKTIGKITGAKMHLDIYNATARGTVTTSAGSITFHAYVPANHQVIYIETHAKGKEKASSWQWKPGRSISPRYLQSYPNDKPKDFPENPDPIFKKEGLYYTCRQPLLNKGGYATVYKVINTATSSKMSISIGYDADGRGDETNEAVEHLRSFSKKTITTRLSEHQNWWHNYYAKSFISLPDKRMENFYWIQLYKLASATRSDKPMLDLMGPWTNPTPWPAIWWNLNTQLAYSPVFTSNHMELGNSLFNTLNSNILNLINNVPERWRKDAAAIGRSSSYNLISPITENQIVNGDFEPSNLTWALYYYYQYYAYSLDTLTLKQKIYPLLKRSANFLMHNLQRDEGGIYHFPMSHSPEYKNAVDANYALSSLRWVLQTLIKTNDDLNLKDKDAERWHDLTNQLVEYPVGETGFLIGKDLPLSHSHRHFSHLMMIYPYNLIDWKNKDQLDVVRKSIEHWLSLKGALQGYTFTGSASMYAMMGEGNRSYELLNELFEKFIQPNTLYRESGPVIETPLAAATTILEMLLQSRGSRIRVFPAIPDQWEEASFDKLSAEGAFLVSAQRNAKKTVFIKVFSSKGGKCYLETDMQINRVGSDKTFTPAITMSSSEGKTNVVFNTIAGETIWFYGYGSSVSAVNPVGQLLYEHWNWGLNKHRY